MRGAGGANETRTRVSGVTTADPQGARAWHWPGPKGFSHGARRGVVGPLPSRDVELPVMSIPGMLSLDSEPCAAVALC